MRQDRLVFFDTGLPYPDGAKGIAKTEAFLNFGNRVLYACEKDDPHRSSSLWEICL